MTLDDLLADYEAKREAYVLSVLDDAKAILGYPEKSKAITDETCRLIRSQSPERSIALTVWGGREEWLWNDDPLPHQVAAKLYLVARDEGLNAAMLWKLSNV